jgi:hypothetical protein
VRPRRRIRTTCRTDHVAGAAHPVGQHAETENVMTKIVHLPVEKIKTDGLQTRASIDAATVREYHEAVAGGARFPAITVFLDSVKVYWLADGFHRLAVAREMGQKRIMAEVHEGGWVDALRFALKANGTHGARRTNADKAHAVQVAYTRRAELGLPDVPAAKMIADLVGIDPGMAGRQLALNAPWAAALARTGADGKTYTLPALPVRAQVVTPATTPAALSSSPVEGAEPEGVAQGMHDEPDLSHLPPLPVRPAAPVGAAPEVGCQRSEIGGADGLAVGQSDGETEDGRTEDAGPVDCRGRHIPEDLLPIWNRRQEVQDLATAISRARVVLEKANDGKDPLWWELNYQAVKADLDKAFFSISSAQPWCVCPMCQGVGCRACSGRGLMSEYRFEQVVPASMRG